jgi:hypothetical protein
VRPNNRPVTNGANGGITPTNGADASTTNNGGANPNRGTGTGTGTDLDTDTDRGRGTIPPIAGGANGSPKGCKSALSSHRGEDLFVAVPLFITCSAAATALALIHHEQESDSAAAERGP